jgi:hypothetical protein
VASHNGGLCVEDNTVLTLWARTLTAPMKEQNTWGKRR